MLLFGYMATLWGYHLIIECHSKVPQARTYKEFYGTIGGKCMIIAYNISALCFLYGTLVGYQVMISNMIGRIMEDYGVENPKRYRLIHILMFSVLVAFPSCLMPSINKIRHASFLPIFTMCYTILVVIIELPYYWTRKVSTYDNMTWFKIDWGFFNSFGITFFSFASHTSYFAAIEKLKKRDTANLYKVYRF